MGGYRSGLAWKRAWRHGEPWVARAVVIGFAALAGLTVVAFTWMTEHALVVFSLLYARCWWGPLLWTPAAAAAIVWLTVRYAPGAAGSGIPQVMAAQDPQVHGNAHALFVSLRLSMAKMLLTAWGLLAGLSLGREGPSVQIAAGVMHHARHFLPRRARVSAQSLLIAGGAAGIAAAFNTPLGGVMFAIEELTRKPEHRNSSLIITAIVLGGMVAVSAYGNASHFGVIHIQGFGGCVLYPAVLLTLACGVFGGLLSRLILLSLDSTSMDRFSQWRRRAPVCFAAACGLVVAVIGVVSHGSTFGSGYSHNRALLENREHAANFYVLLKWVATWLTTWSGVPGGIFAPSLGIGGALGSDIAQWTAYLNPPTLIALGMAAFLAAVTQAPLTASIIVMEMVDGHALVLSLMACAMVASAVSKAISRPLYGGLAELQLRRLSRNYPDRTCFKGFGAQRVVD